MADLNECYRILGIVPGASFDDARAAWRLRAQELHPDRLHDAPSAERAAAERQFKELAEAWRVVRAHFGDAGPTDWPEAMSSPRGAGSNQKWAATPGGEPRRGLPRNARATLIAALAAAVIVAGIVLVTNSRDSEEFPAEMQAAFIDQCEATTPADTCRCLLDNIMDEYSADEYRKVIYDLRAGGMAPAALRSIVADCEN